MGSEDQLKRGSENEISSYLDWLNVKEPVARRQFFTRMGKSMLVLGAAGGLPAILAACSSAASPSAAAAQASAAAAAPSVAAAASMAAPSAAAAVASAAAAKQYRVAFLIWINNPYWEQVSQQVTKLLKPRLAPQGVIVDLVEGAASASATQMSNAIDSVVTRKYDGLIVAGVDPAMNPAIGRAMAANIPCSPSAATFRGPRGSPSTDRTTTRSARTPPHLWRRGSRRRTSWPSEACQTA